MGACGELVKRTTVGGAGNWLSGWLLGACGELAKRMAVEGLRGIG